MDINEALRKIQDGYKEKAKITERTRIVNLIKNCPKTWDPVYDDNVSQYLENLATRIENGDL